MNPKKLRLFTALLPILAIGVATFIVSWEYVRRARLTSELAGAETEIARLEKLRPTPLSASQSSDHKHDHKD